MKKYMAIMLALLLTAAVVLSGCSSKKQKNENKTTVKFATFYTEKDQGAVYKQIIEEFEKKNSDIKVEIITDMGDDEKIKESLSEKGEYDIIGLRRDQVIEYAKSGFITDLSDMIEKGELDKKLYKISLAYGSYNGKIYGIGDMPLTMEWFYNTDMFEKYNISEPKTLSDLISISDKLKSRNIIPIGVGAMDGWTLNTIFGMITAQTTGVSELTKNYGTDEGGYKNIPGVKKAFDIFGKITKNSIPINSTEINYMQSVDDFIKGKSAMLPALSRISVLINDKKPSGFHYQTFETPVTFVEQPVSLFSAAGGQVVSVAANAKNKKEADKFLEFLFSEDAQKIIVEKGYISPLISANENDGKVQQQILGHLEMTDDDSVMFMDNLPSDMAENTTRVLQDILEDRVKPSEAWDRILRFTFKK